MMNAITTKWTTLAITGYRGSVSRNEERRAHGGVCLLQVRRGANGILGRRVNSNGRHRETSEAFAMDDATLANWQAIAKASN